MNKLITTLTIVALTTVTLVGTAAAGPGNGNQNQQMGGQQSPQINLGGIFKPSGKGGSYGGGDTTSPGDAFYPDVAVGDPKAECLALGGKPRTRISADGNVFVICV